MYTLLIWQNLAYGRDLMFLIPNDSIDAEFRSNLEKAAGKYINLDDDSEDLDALSFIQNKFFNYELVDHPTYATPLYEACIVEGYNVSAHMTNVYIMGIGD